MPLSYNIIYSYSLPRPGLGWMGWLGYHSGTDTAPRYELGILYTNQSGRLRWMLVRVFHAIASIPGHFRPPDISDPRVVTLAH